MDMKDAALKMVKLAEKSTNLPANHPEYGVDHLMDMGLAIVNGQVIGEKAHRWLGWMQGCLCMAGDATLDELKKINSGQCADCGDCDCKK